MSRPSRRSFLEWAATRSSFRWKTPPSVGRTRAVKSPSFTAHFFNKRSTNQYPLLVRSSFAGSGLL